jgi:glutamine amidotransferase PdxT
MKIGVLALQGDFAEHVTMLKLKVEAVEVRLPNNWKPGWINHSRWWSTTIGKLASDYGLEPLREFGKRHAIWGIVGAIFSPKMYVGTSPSSV